MFLVGFAASWEEVPFSESDPWEDCQFDREGLLLTHWDHLLLILLHLPFIPYEGWVGWDQRFSVEAQRVCCTEGFCRRTTSLLPPCLWGSSRAPSQNLWGPLD